MTIPDYQSVMLPLLQLSADGVGSVLTAEVNLAQHFDLSEDERAELLPSGKQRIFHNRVHWAKFYLQKAGLLESPQRGKFQITQLGKKVLAQAPEAINVAYLRQFPDFDAFYLGQQNGGGTSASAEISAPTEATPEEVIEGAQKTIEAALRAELLDRILQSSPTFFEGLIVDLLLAMGYGGSRRDASERLGKSGDGGVDGVINEDILGLDRIYVQAKRYAPATTVGRPEVQAFTGSLVGMGATKGFFVTTSSFSYQAMDFASRIPQRVILIDGTRLSDLMVRHGVGVRLSRVFEFKRLDEDFFSEEL